MDLRNSSLLSSSIACCFRLFYFDYRQKIPTTIAAQGFPTSYMLVLLCSRLCISRTRKYVLVQLLYEFLVGEQLAICHAFGHFCVIIEFCKKKEQNEIHLIRHHQSLHYHYIILPTNKKLFATPPSARQIKIPQIVLDHSYFVFSGFYSFSPIFAVVIKIEFEEKILYTNIFCSAKKYY